MVVHRSVVRPKECDGVVRITAGWVVLGLAVTGGCAIALWLASANRGLTVTVSLASTGPLGLWHFSIRGLKQLCYVRTSTSFILIVRPSRPARVIEDIRVHRAPTLSVSKRNGIAVGEMRSAAAVLHVKSRT